MIRCPARGMLVIVDIELLMVRDCPHQAAAVELVHTALADTRITASVTTTVVATLDDAERLGFVGSPTIRIDGRDPFAQPDAHIGIACRIYSTPDGLAGVPSLLRREVKTARLGVTLHHIGHAEIELVERLDKALQRRSWTRRIGRTERIIVGRFCNV